MLNITSNSVDQLLVAGHAALRAGRHAEAEHLFNDAACRNPTCGPAFEGLGMAWLLMRRRNDAAAAFVRAIELHPTPESYLHLGQMLSQGGKKPEGVEVLTRAIAAFPNDERVAAEYARALETNGQNDEAAAAYERALARWPGSQLVTYYYGAFLFFQGDIARAIAINRACLKAHPADAVIHSALLFVLHFQPGLAPEALLAEQRAWDHQHGMPRRGKTPPFANDRNPDRLLRIGYVSPDFKNHGVGRFMMPILAQHDLSQCEIFVYADGTSSDVFTKRLQRQVAHWTHGYGESDAQLAAKIRADGIDILVDLTMHMPGNRMTLFASRAAPVQVTYLAYCSTTGLATMDYRLSDPHLDPPGWDARYAEKTIRLPKSWWLYEAPEPAPPVQPRPNDGPFTFGCLNNLAKSSPEALGAWAKILHAVPGARLLLHAPTGSGRRRTAAALTSTGIAPERVEFFDRLPLDDYFAFHHRVDVALDPFPYAGGTSTCDALWMGVPVITLAGNTAVGRGSTSILTNLGLPELIAHDPEEYVQRAAVLAGDRARRAELRGSLRRLMQASPLMDARGFINGLEEAYRTMWKSWCKKT